MDDEVNEDPRLGSVVQGRYRILSRIADGSMGAVYRAERLQLGRPVAIKFLHASYASDPQFIQRFERETRVMSKLSHPHCVSVIDFGVEGAPYVVMEMVSGRTLRTLLDAGPVEVDRSIHIARQLLGGLAHAHAQDIIHRDIKPANIMLTEATGTGDHVRILDFGLATLRGGAGNDVSQSQIVVGTPSYMSPEQSMATKVDARADVYSTGVVLFELLTGQKPFNAEDTFELLGQHRSAPVPRLADVAPETVFPAGLQVVIDRAMAKQPDDRFESAIEFAEALEAAVRQPAVPDRREVAFAPTQAMRAESEPRRRGMGAGGLFMVLLVLGTAAYAGYRLAVDRGEKADAARADDAAREVSRRALAPESPAATAAPAAAARDAAPLVAAPVDAGRADGGGAPGDGGPSMAGATDLLDGGADEVAAEPPLPAEEQEEPVAPIPEEAEADIAEPTTPAEAQVDQQAAAAEEALPVVPPPAAVSRPAAPATPSVRKPNPVDTVAEAVALIRAGRREQAIRALKTLRKKMPRSAYVPYLLGNLYFGKRWWTVGMDYYRAAIRNNRVYRGKRILNQNVVRALGDARTRRKATSLFTTAIGRAALPYLRRAARSDKNLKVRRAAAALVRRLARRR